MKYTTDVIQNMFLDFFKKEKHKIIPSSSLEPKKNSNLLFTNAGMNQFQDVFLGKKKYPFSKIVTVQRCLRTGGKHNDFDQVGYSEYHNTFFNMLGNFSFGAYNKETAIVYAWTLLTHRKWFNIPKEKLFVTVYYEDYESYNIWNKIIKLKKKNIIIVYDKKNKKYESDNFWNMGYTGPCGPCTEIFFKKIKKKNHLYDLEDKMQCVEIWNIVFIQFNKINENHIVPLNTVSIDTGMGLERLASVLQNVSSNYEIDIFKKIQDYICTTNNLINPNRQSLNVVSDHIRAAVFILADKITPENDGRGYVLRKIIRRALCHGNKLGIKSIFLYTLVDIIIQTQTNKDQNLTNQKKYIIKILKEEELQFYETLKNGLKFLKKKINTLKNKYINHEIVFYLHDTLGFPINLTQEICRENKIYINQKKLNDFITEYKKNIKDKNQKKIDNHIIYTNYKSQFFGYEKYKINATVKKIFINGQQKKQILKDEIGIIILDKTPFFGESGGQIGDTGSIYYNNSIFHVQDTKIFTNTTGHIGYLKSGKVQINDIIIAKIDKKKRIFIQNNHTTTHLLHAALKKILNYPIEQKGSFINDEYLRFDFSYPYKIKMDEISKIEYIINKNIQKNIIIENKNMDFKIAKHENYIFLKDKTYNTSVRTISINDISKEICKGTHSKNTGEIGVARINSCKNIAFSIKRIEMTTGIKALKKIQQQEYDIKNIQNILQTNQNTLIPKIKKIIQQYEKIKTENRQLSQIIIQFTIKKLLQKIKKIKDIETIIHHINIKSIKSIKILINQIKKKIHAGIIILFYPTETQYIFVIGVTHNLIQKIQAPQIIKIINKYVKSIGGGNPELAQCISENITDISKIIIHIQNWILSKI